MKRKALKLLADYMFAIPSNYENFSMASYADTYIPEEIGYDGILSEVEKKIKQKSPKIKNHFFDIDDPFFFYTWNKTGMHCGTAACMAGHLPFVKGIPKPKPEESWPQYIYRTTGVKGFQMDRTEKEEKVFDWLFGGEWAEVDDTPRGAARRVYWFLKHGVPEDHYLQMHGHAELCYLKENGEGL